MRCYRKILHISYKDHVTNEEVHAKIQQAIWPHKDLLTIVKRCKLQWYGHVSPFIRSCQNHLARHRERGKKTRHTEEEVGRQHQGMDRPGVRKVPEGSGEREKWRKLVAKSSVVPQWPSWLRDRWWDGDEVISLSFAQWFFFLNTQKLQVLYLSLEEKMFFRRLNVQVSVQYKNSILQGFGSALRKFAGFCQVNVLNSNPSQTSDDVAPLKVNSVNAPLCLSSATHACESLVNAGWGEGIWTADE